MLNRRRALQFAAVLPTAVFQFANGAAKKLALTVSPAEPAAGDMITITWSVPNGMKPHLLGWGDVGQNGSVSFKAERTTAIVLTADGPNGAELISASVHVGAMKGDEEEFEPNRERFRYPYSCSTHVSATYGTALRDIRSVLRDRLGLLDRVMEATETMVVMETNRWRVADIQRDLQPQYYGRRLSYLLEISGPGVFKPGYPVSVTIKSLIEIRRKAEPQWYLETDGDLYKAQTMRLASLL
jgi:hypothetical protein